MTSENPNTAQELQRLLDEFTLEIERQTQQCRQLNQYIRDATHNRQALESCCSSITQSIASASRRKTHKQQADALMGDDTSPLGLIVCDREERLAELLDIQAKIARDEFDDNAQLIASLKDMARKAEEGLKQNKQHAKSLRQKLERLSTLSRSGLDAPQSLLAFRMF